MWVDLDAPLGTPKGHVDAGTLEGHEGGEGLHLVLAHVKAVTDS